MERCCGNGWLWQSWFGSMLYILYKRQVRFGQLKETGIQWRRVRPVSTHQKTLFVKMQHLKIYPKFYERLCTNVVFSLKKKHFLLENTILLLRNFMPFNDPNKSIDELMGEICIHLFKITPIYDETKDDISSQRLWKYLPWMKVERSKIVFMLLKL